MNNQNQTVSPNQHARAKNFLGEILNPIMKELQEKYVIESGRHAEDVIDYLVKLFAKHQDWKNHRLLRYTVEHFNLKTKTNESDQVQGS